MAMKKGCVDYPIPKIMRPSSGTNCVRNLSFKITITEMSEFRYSLLIHSLIFINHKGFCVSKHKEVVMVE